MKIKRLLAIILAVLILALSFTACGKDDASAGKDKENASQGSSESGDNGFSVDESPYRAIPEKLQCKKITTIKKNINYVSDNGFVYSENDKWGFISFDGKTDTGAKYGHIDPVGDCFAFTTKEYNPAPEIATDLNKLGLIDKSGKVLLDEKYAFIYYIGSTFYKVCTVEAYNEDINDPHINIVSINIDDKYYSCKGTWEVFDASTGKIVPNINGNDDENLYAQGPIISFTRDYMRHIYFSNGDKSDDYTIGYDNGYYSVGRKVYKPDGTLAFEATDYSIDGQVGDYIRGNRDDKFFLVDFEGNIISAEFNFIRYQYGKFIVTSSSYNNNIYDFEGNLLYENVRYDVYFDEVFRFALSAKIDAGDAVLLAATGEELYRGDFESDNNYALQTYKGDWIDGDFFCIKDRDFTVHGNKLADWLVESDGNIIDLVSGNTIIKNYEYYEANEIDGFGVVICAYKINGNYNEFDVYIVR